MLSGMMLWAGLESGSEPRLVSVQILARDSSAPHLPAGAQAGLQEFVWRELSSWGLRAAEHTFALPRCPPFFLLLQKLIEI